MIWGEERRASPTAVMPTSEGGRNGRPPPPSKARGGRGGWGEGITPLLVNVEHG